VVVACGSCFLNAGEHARNKVFRFKWLLNEVIRAEREGALAAFVPGPAAKENNRRPIGNVSLF